MTLSIKYITEIGEAFTEAILSIKESDHIAVDCEGDQLGRNGKLCLVQVATEREIFIFDYIALGNDLFDQGLKSVLESGSIIKAFYDCRGDSDILFHQHGIRLKGVMDVALSEVYYRFKSGMGTPRFLKGYRKCVEMYLNTTDARFHNIKQSVAQLMSSAGTAFWLQRPLCLEVIEYAAYDVKYLRELHVLLTSVLNKEDLRWIKRGSDKFQKMTRDTEISTPSNPMDSARVPDFFAFNGVPSDPISSPYATVYFPHSPLPGTKYGSMERSPVYYHANNSPTYQYNYGMSSFPSAHPYTVPINVPVSLAL